MRENRFPWGGRFVLLLAMLTMLMTMPALALFDHDDLATGVGVTPIAENLSLTTYKNVAVNGSFTAVDPDGGSVTFRVTKRGLPASPIPPMRTRPVKIASPMWRRMGTGMSPSRPPSL